MSTPTILIVDDEPSQRSVLSGYLRKKKYPTLEASSADEALKELKKNAAGIVLTDLKMPGKSGHDLLKEINSLYPETAVVLMTAFGTIEDAVQAMRDGAYDYLTKPIDLEEMEILIGRIIERSRLVSENRLMREQLKEKFSFKEFVSQSRRMETVLNTAGRVAASRAAVLIRGESGTGKELIAKIIHFNSPRAGRPFIPVNCAALNENLLESELFGHEKGAFTGAEKQRRGRFELADGGTIFLDEIGDVSPATQVKLLRVLQEQEFERVGGTDTIKVDVRILAATNRDLEGMMKTGKFREDLYYRLNVVPVVVPPLRERRDDIAPLLEHFLKRYADEQAKTGLSFSREAWELLTRYDYPGNVRELENIIQRAAILTRDETITTAELPGALKNMKGENEIPAGNEPVSLPYRVEKLEKELVLEALAAQSGNQSKAAELLGISERNLRYKLKKWGVK